MVKVFYNENTLEAVARNVLCGYNKEYLNAEPQPVPIEHIIENTYGLSIEYKNITNNSRILGKTIFDDGLTPYYDTDDHEYKLMKVNSGTIIIDESLLQAKCYGRLRFTYAHELAHWIIHKKIYMGTGEAAAFFTNEYDDATEWQANVLATNILMPTGQIKRCYYNTRNKCIPSNIDFEMSSTFQVSKQAMKIRLQSLGLM